MWLLSLLVVVSVGDRVLSIPDPGNLRVPKVYNAVITSNQNLAPSRAYPVIQPVVHRTAIGYVPPFYYTQIAPGYSGPEVRPLLSPGGLGHRREEEGRQERPEVPPARPDEVESVEATDGSSSSNSPPPKKVIRPNSNTRDIESSGELSSAESSENQSTSSSSSSDSNGKPKKNKNDRVPLSFYPNYQSLYYDPYFYPYNNFPPQFAAPGTYYVNYPQPPGILGPLPPQPPPPIGHPGYPVPAGRPETPPEGSDSNNNSRRNEKQIPDVPPPPLPTTMRKKSS